MYKVILRLLVASVCLVTVCLVGCFVSVPYEKTETAIPPGQVLEMRIELAEGEVVEGSWGADEAIEGSYQRPDETKFYWTVSSTEHSFTISGENNPGVYLFSFHNTGAKVTTLKFRYRIKEPSAATSP